MSFNLSQYIDHLSSLQYHNYTIKVNYYDLRFTYKNVVPGIQHTLEIFGVVDLVDVREYLIYSRTKNSNVDVWDVRVPEIANGYNTPARINTSAGPMLTGNISKIPEHYVNCGLGFDTVIEQGPTNPNNYVSNGKEIKIYLDTPTNEVVYDNTQAPVGNKITLSGPKYISEEINKRIRNYVIDKFSRYNEYPTIKLDSPNFSAENGLYNEIPLGLSKYKIVLTSATGEIVQFYITGTPVQGLANATGVTLQNNKIYSPSPVMESAFTDVPVISPVGSIIIDNDVAILVTRDVPDILGVRISTARLMLSNAGFTNIIETKIIQRPCDSLVIYYSPTAREGPVDVTKPVYVHYHSNTT